MSSTLIESDGDEQLKQLNKDEIKERIAKLKELVKNDDTLRKYRQDDEWLFQFLVCNKFDVNKSFKKMLEYAAFMVECQDWIACKPPLEMSTQFEHKYIAFLSDRDNQKRGIMIYRFCNVNTDSTPQEHAQTLEMLVDQKHFLFPEIRENGFSAILDAKRLPLKLLTWCTPGNIKACIKMIEQYPTPSILIHVVNTALLLDVAIKIIWPFLPEKIKNTVKFHFTDWSSLHQYISPDSLPMEYGGTQPNVDFEESNQQLYADNDIIEERLRLRQAFRT